MIFFFALGAIFVIIPFGKGGNLGWVIFLWRTAILLLFVFAWVWQLASARRGPLLRGHSTGYEYPLVVFIAWCLLSLIFSTNRYDATSAVVDLVTYTALFYLFYLSIDTKKAVPLFVLFIFSTLLQAFWILVQSYLPRMGSLATGIDSGIQARAAGSFFDPNYAASFVLTGLITALAMLFDSWKAKKPKALIWAFLSIIYLWALVANGSRGAFVALIAVLVFFGLYIGRWAIGILVAATLVLVTIPNPVRERLLLFRYGDRYPIERIRIWEKSLEMIRDHPVIGVGLGDFSDYADSYDLPVPRGKVMYSRRFTKAHSSYLQIGAELGLPGLVLILVMLGILGFQCAAAMRMPSDRRQRYQLLAAAGSVIALGLQAMVSNNYQSRPNMMVGLLAAAVIASSYREIRSKGYGSALLKIASQGKDIRIALSLSFLAIALLLWYVFCLKPYLGVSYFNKAREALGRQALNNAITMLSKAIEYDPSHPDYRVSMGNLRLKLFDIRRDPGNLKTAIDAYSTALKLNPHRHSYRFQIARALEKASNAGIRPKLMLREAAEQYKIAIGMDPKNVFYRYNLALIYMKTGREETAARLLEDAVRREPYFIKGHHLLAALYRRMGLEKEARRRERIYWERSKALEGEKAQSAYERLLFQRP